MNILIRFIIDILHIAKMLVICKMYLALDEKVNDHQRYFKAGLIIVISSILINRMENQSICMLFYFACVECVLFICYREEIKHLLVIGILVLVISETKIPFVLESRFSNSF